MKIVLASASPRRRDMLERTGVAFETFASDIDERIECNLPPGEAVSEISKRKAEHAFQALRIPPRSDTLIIAADTLVVIDGEIMGKPSDEEDAFRMIKALQSRKHTVFTGVTLIKAGSGGGINNKTFFEAAGVFMRALDEAEIRAYIATGEPMDKAGAYGIQEKGAVLIERVEGDFHTVVGLPLARLCVEMKSMGVDITDIWTGG